ncbi:MAG: glycosyl hydrolase 108 family protein [Marinobacter sp.]|nr:glycosyl hydrolase 108 family protein [Marinobacter sp.]
MRRLTQIIDDLIEREGGYVHHEDDKGGPTMYGITEKVARLHNFDGKMQHMPKTLAVAIYKDQYWSGPNFDRVAMLNQHIAEEMLDTGVNMGISVAGAFLQRALNALNNQGTHYSDLVVDGLIGNSTIGALKDYLDRRQHEGERVLLKALNCLQGERYIEIAEGREANESFVFGWFSHRVGL